MSNWQPVTKEVAELLMTEHNVKLGYFVDMDSKPEKKKKKASKKFYHRKKKNPGPKRTYMSSGQMLSFMERSDQHIVEGGKPAYLESRRKFYYTTRGIFRRNNYNPMRRDQLTAALKEEFNGNWKEHTDISMGISVMFYWVKCLRRV